MESNPLHKSGRPGLRARLMARAAEAGAAPPRGDRRFSWRAHVSALGWLLPSGVGLAGWGVWALPGYGPPVAEIGLLQELGTAALAALVGGLVGWLVFRVVQRAICASCLRRERSRPGVPGEDAQLRQLFEHAGVGLAIVGLDDRIVRANFRLSAMLGYDPQELAGRAVSDVTHPDDVRLHLQHRARLTRGEISSYTLEKRFMRRDGTPVWCKITNSLVTRAGQEPDAVISVVEDITHRSELEALLRHSQKMDAVGQLAGGVAHDFNNLLTAIQGHTTLLRMEPALSSDARESIEEITNASRRAASLTRQLLLFSRREVMQPKRLDLNDCVTQFGRMLQRLIGEKIRMRLQLWPHALPIHADPGMIDQVLMNLAVNARDAMPEGGELTVATCRLLVDEAGVGDNPRAHPGRHACLTVRDTGCGIAPENRLRIFEPFFTTKPAGKGTGLGLATVFGIVKQHHGWVEVHSEPGLGATFRVFLPITDSLPEDIAVAPAREVPRAIGETVLLVEDDEPVRRMASLAMTRHGYQVVACASGREALDWWEAGHRGLDVLFTDVVLPGEITGRSVADRIRADLPGLKVILTSGYSTELDGAAHQSLPGEMVLPKPYGPAQLLSVLDRLLRPAERDRPDSGPSIQ